MIAFIPAKASSQRIEAKNFRVLAGHPLVAYAIAAAQQSGACERVVVVAESGAMVGVARLYGADTCDRPPVVQHEPDIVWLRHALTRYPTDAFAIVRCTSPFRSARTIRAAWGSLQGQRWADSTRVITPWTGPHPAKMWYPHGKRIDRIRPVWDGSHPDGTPWHSSPTQTLKPVYVQTAGLEIGWTARTIEKGTIAGEQVLPYIVRGHEALDINMPEDWERAEQIAREHPEFLPRIEVAA